MFFLCKDLVQISQKLRQQDIKAYLTHTGSYHRTLTFFLLIVINVSFSYSSKTTLSVAAWTCDDSHN